jgi:hypothetical protein
MTRYYLYDPVDKHITGKDGGWRSDYNLVKPYNTKLGADLHVERLHIVFPNVEWINRVEIITEEQLMAIKVIEEL